jgi:hemerythrin
VAGVGGMTFVEGSGRKLMNFRLCDEQQARLLGLIDELYEALQNSKGKDKVVSRFKATIAFTQKHFREEEKLMLSLGYPALDDQKQSHELFVSEVHNLFAQFKRGCILTISVFNFLKRVERHILDDDKEYGQFLNSKGLH